jgi:hypothetical protein
MNGKFETDVRGFVRSFAALAGVSLVLAGCGDTLQNVVITLPEHQATASNVQPSVGSAAKVRIGPVKDTRTEFVGRAIGKKTTIGDIAIGNIEISSFPSDLMAKLLRTELSAAGHNIVESGEDFRIDPQLFKFSVLTPATVTYWDINGSVALLLRITSPKGKKHEARYATTCTDRTFVGPSGALITNVVKSCVEKIATQLRGDVALAKFLAP